MSSSDCNRANKMNKEEYVDHEVRIRMLEKLYGKMDNKMNAIITIALTSVFIPLVMKYFGL